MPATLSQITNLLVQNMFLDDNFWWLELLLLMRSWCEVIEICCYISDLRHTNYYKEIMRDSKIEKFVFL